LIICIYPYVTDILKSIYPPNNSLNSSPPMTPFFQISVVDIVGKKVQVSSGWNLKVCFGNKCLQVGHSSFLHTQWDQCQSSKLHCMIGRKRRGLQMSMHWLLHFLLFLTIYKCSLCCWLKCEHVLYFSHFQNWKFLNSAMWTHWGLNWFFLPNPIFAICLNFQQQNPSKNQYLPHLSSENCEIDSIKSDLPMVFQ
jgi:hypothetical protein